MGGVENTSSAVAAGVSPENIPMAKKVKAKDFKRIVLLFILLPAREKENPRFDGAKDRALYPFLPNLWVNFQQIFNGLGRNFCTHLKREFRRNLFSHRQLLHF